MKIYFLFIWQCFKCNHSVKTVFKHNEHSQINRVTRVSATYLSFPASLRNQRNFVIFFTRILRSAVCCQRFKMRQTFPGHCVRFCNRTVQNVPGLVNLLSVGSLIILASTLGIFLLLHKYLSEYISELILKYYKVRLKSFQIKRRAKFCSIVTSET